MTEFISEFLETILSVSTNSVLSYFAENLTIAADLAFDAESIITGVIGSVSGLITVAYGYAVLWLIIKFIKKGVDIYILKIDGDSDSDPFILLTNFFKAMIISICFGIMYQYFIAIFRDMTSALLNAVGFDINSMTITAIGVDIVSAIASQGLLPIVLLCIYLILYTILMVQFLIKGVWLMILRYGVVFATPGILDSDGGSYKPFIKKLFQIGFTILVQVILFQISIPLMVALHPFYAVAVLAAAMTAPKVLQEFVMVGQGNATQSLYSANMLLGMFKKGA